LYSTANASNSVLSVGRVLNTGVSTSNATNAEIDFKHKLDLFKIKYVFQYRIDYKDTFIIADFFIKSIKMVIEVDGGYHKKAQQREKDAERDAYLKSKGYKVLRVLNEDVDTFEVKHIIKHFKAKKAIIVTKKEKKVSKLQAVAEKIERQKLQHKKTVLYRF
jgi:very-short-patch-repair endonuclease